MVGEDQEEAEKDAGHVVRTQSFKKQPPVEPMSLRTDVYFFEVVKVL